jgi:DNA repair exonuclease SbcCD ATPase subunit
MLSSSDIILKAIADCESRCREKELLLAEQERNYQSKLSERDRVMSEIKDEYKNMEDTFHERDISLTKEMEDQLLEIDMLRREYDSLQTAIRKEQEHTSIECSAYRDCLKDGVKGLTQQLMSVMSRLNTILSCDRPFAAEWLSVDSLNQIDQLCLKYTHIHAK